MTSGPEATTIVELRCSVCRDRGDQGGGPLVGDLRPLPERGPDHYQVAQHVGRPSRSSDPAPVINPSPPGAMSEGRRLYWDGTLEAIADNLIHWNCRLGHRLRFDPEQIRRQLNLGGRVLWLAHA